MRWIKRGALVCAVIGVGGVGFAYGAATRPDRPTLTAQRIPTTTTTAAPTTTTTVAPSTTATTERPPAVIVLTNSATLSAALNTAAGELMGKNAPVPSHQRFIAEYHASERSFQQGVYDGAATVVRPAEPLAAGRAFVNRVHEREVRDYQMMLRLRQFNEMIGPDES